MQLENQRKLTDSNYYTVVGLPATNGTTVYTPSFDLVQPFSTSEQYALQIDIANTSASSGSITAFLQHASDNATWYPIPETGTITVSSSSGTTPFYSDQWRLPPTAQEYVRAGLTFYGGGNISSSSGTFSVRF